MRYGKTTARAIVALGLALVALSGAAPGGEALDDRLGIRTVTLFLLLRADVQADLGLDSKQIAHCNRAARAFYERATKVRGRTGHGAEQARKEIDDQELRWLQAVLTPDQRARLEQIDLQWEGAGAMLSRPLLDESLELSPEQKQKVIQIVKAARAERGSGTWSYEQHTELTRQAIAVLNDRQKELWIHLLGHACRFKIGQAASSSVGDQRGLPSAGNSAQSARAGAPAPAR
jgi:hypothetical protein